MTQYSHLRKTPILMALLLKRNSSWQIRELLRKQFLLKFNGKVAVIQQCKRRRKRERERKSLSKRKLNPSLTFSKIVIQTPIKLKMMLTKRNKNQMMIKRRKRMMKKKKRKRRPFKIIWTQVIKSKMISCHWPWSTTQVLSKLKRNQMKKTIVIVMTMVKRNLRRNQRKAKNYLKVLIQKIANNNDCFAIIYLFIF